MHYNSIEFYCFRSQNRWKFTYSLQKTSFEAIYHFKKENWKFRIDGIIQRTFAHKNGGAISAAYNRSRKIILIFLETETIFSWRSGARFFVEDIERILSWTEVWSSIFLTTPKSLLSNALPKCNKCYWLKVATKDLGKQKTFFKTFQCCLFFEKFENNENWTIYENIASALRKVNFSLVNLLSNPTKNLLASVLVKCNSEWNLKGLNKNWISRKRSSTLCNTIFFCTKSNWDWI